MKAALKSFGVLEIEGKTYRNDVVVDRGKVLKRKKSQSGKKKIGFGHTPLTIQENIPWDCKTLLIGNGVYGSLPITDEVKEEAKRRGVDLIIGSTNEICKKLSLDPPDTNVILHCTC